MAKTTDQPKMTAREFLATTGKMAVIVYRVAPGAIIVQLIGAIISALLPIATTYFAALTTTALASAYAGDAMAGRHAVEYVIITVLLGAVVTIWRGIQEYLQQAMRYRVETTMTNQMYEHFLQLDFWRYDDKDTADLYEKARKFGIFFPNLFERLSSLFAAVIVTITAVAALGLVNWWLALIILVAVIPNLYFQMRLSRLQVKHWNDSIAARRVVGRIEWGVMSPENIVEIRLYGLVRYILALRQKMRDKDEKTRIDYAQGYIGRRLGAELFAAAAEASSLIWVTLQIIHQQQPIGQFIYVQQLVGRALGGANNLADMISMTTEDMANLYEYQRFMALPENTNHGHALSAPPKQIVIDNISFHYPGTNRDVLRGVSLSISHGQHVAIVGENGAGKTTLIKLLSGIYQPSQGRILLDGSSLADVVIDDWHKYLSVLSQNFVKYDFADARHNISYGDTSRRLNHARVEAAIDAAEAGFLHELPQGLDNYVDQWMEDDNGKKGQDLSGGQWQRLALARNFYRDASIIILDEPTSAIDALAESRIFQRLFSMKDKTIVTISHRFTTVKKADVIYMLKDGRVAEYGTADELVARRGEFYRMFESQI